MLKKEIDENLSNNKELFDDLLYNLHEADNIWNTIIKSNDIGSSRTNICQIIEIINQCSLDFEIILGRLTTIIKG